MRLDAKRLVAKFVVCLIVLSVSFSFAADQFPRAPQLSFTGLSGEKLSLDQFKGSVVLLNFWTTSCGVCLSEIPALSALQNQYGSQGLRVVGVALDSDSTSIRKVMSQRHISYTIVSGDETMEEQLGADGFPATFVIGRDGRIYSEHSGAISRDGVEDELKQLLAAQEQASVEDFRPAAGAQMVRMPAPAELNSEIPGIDVSHLSKQELAQLKHQLESEPCPCGCNRTVLQCRSAHSSCNFSKEIAQEAAKKLHGGMI